MRLSSITIKNLAAFSEFSTTLPAVALIQGKNGLGKTSLQAVIRYAYGRRADGSRAVEHDPRMLHGNSEEGEVTITHDDGTQLKCVVTTAGTTRYVKPQGGKRWSKATGDIDALANALSYDPLQFKNFDERKRVETLLRIMPAQVTVEEITAALDGVGIAQPHAPSLEAINAYYSEIYDLRREQNVAADTQEKHARELEQALPVEPEGKYQDLGLLRQAKAAIEEQERNHVKTVGDTFRKYEADEKLAHAERVRVFTLESLKQATDATEAARAEANASVLAKRSELQPERDRLTAAIATAEEQAKQLAVAEGTRQALTRAKSEAEARRGVSARMTEALDRLKALKETVAGRLPIKGITIAAPREGLPVDICREEKTGVCQCGHDIDSHKVGPCKNCTCGGFAVGTALIPFSSWNDTSKLLFCLRLAVLTHGQCGLVCVDSIDAVDPETRKKLEETCRKYAKSDGLQFLLGEATGGELRVQELEG